MFTTFLPPLCLCLYLHVLIFIPSCLHLHLCITRTKWHKSISHMTHKISVTHSPIHSSTRPFAIRSKYHLPTPCRFEADFSESPTHHQPRGIKYKVPTKYLPYPQILPQSELFQNSLKSQPASTSALTFSFSSYYRIKDSRAARKDVHLTGRLLLTFPVRSWPKVSTHLQHLHFPFCGPGSGLPTTSTIALWHFWHFSTAFFRSRVISTKAPGARDCRWTDSIY